MKKIFMLAIACTLIGTAFATDNNDDKKKNKQKTEHCCKKGKCCKSKAQKA